MEPVYTPVIGFARTLFAAQGLRFTISGAHHVPRTGGAVMAMNHLSYFDYAYAGLPALDSRRLVRWMAKKEIFDHAVMGPLMRGMKHIPVDREAGAAAFDEAVTALRSGEIVGVFPETTISRSYELREFKTGAVRMAMEAGVPILPTIAWGNHRVWTKDHPKQLGRSRTPITLTVGEPVEVAPGTDPVEATARLRAVMEEMLHRAQDEYEPLTGENAKYAPARIGGAAPTVEDAARLDQEEAAARAARRAERSA
ncbi:lysophospholipid acyltransferase family protein [Luteipulveratus flavus]|uniref:Lysophospholipid acyltransferase family protein n=1 Tax=Luteipulveratus flavus TaxID=3031728 RepID=A0ABT6CAF2_9MICO|nr:lysophospholipid acyltransferase family protein [Luteipulveratus sp. YIM 133296]MDF8265880.1 lysophospholipid acyltransferase family protein [Luteipulveratus sp. YIM 133296]